MLALVETLRSPTGSPFTLAELAAGAETTFGMPDSMRTGAAVDLSARLPDYGF